MDTACIRFPEIGTVRTGRARCAYRAVVSHPLHSRPLCLFNAAVLPVLTFPLPLHSPTYQQPSVALRQSCSCRTSVHSPSHTASDISARNCIHTESSLVSSRFSRPISTASAATRPLKSCSLCVEGARA